jgi:hypothetical protein
MAQKLSKAPQEDSGTTAPAKRSPAGRNGSGKTPAKKSAVKKTDPLKLDMDVFTHEGEIVIHLHKQMEMIALSGAQAQSLALQLGVLAKDLGLMTVVAMQVMEILSTEETEAGAVFADTLFQFAIDLLHHDWFVEQVRERLRSR